MDRLGDRVETIERKSLWYGQPSNTRRNPNFRKNQNPNTRKTGPDQNIRPPFQENYAQASTSDEPIEDTQINLMGLNNEQQVFLTREDQEAHTQVNNSKLSEVNHLTLGRDMIQPFMKSTNNTI